MYFLKIGFALITLLLSQNVLASPSTCYTYLALGGKYSKHICLKDKVKNGRIVTSVSLYAENGFCWVNIITQQFMKVGSILGKLTLVSFSKNRNIICGSLFDDKGTVQIPIIVTPISQSKLKIPQTPTWTKIIKGKDSCVKYILTKNKRTKIYSYMCFGNTSLRKHYLWARMKSYNGKCLLVYSKRVIDKKQFKTPRGVKDQLSALKFQKSIELSAFIVCHTYSVISANSKKGILRLH